MTQQVLDKEKIIALFEELDKDEYYDVDTIEIRICNYLISIKEGAYDAPNEGDGQSASIQDSQEFNERPWQPSPPGDTIRDIMEERGISRLKLGKLLDIGDEQLSQLLSGIFIIDNDMVYRLALALGSTPKFWENRERQYREELRKGGEQE